MARHFQSVAAVLLVVVTGSVARSQSFFNFESPQARPIALSANADVLYAVNTPACSLEVFSLKDPTKPVLIKEIRVGLEPVSVAVRSADEVWVVDHVSDAISVVCPSRGTVVATIRVGDRPGDVVFAGTPLRAFVTSMTERTVAVIDPESHSVVKTIAVAGDAPRALLASADGKSVWVAISRSGNKTTVVPHTIAPAPPTPTNKALPPAPRQGIIVNGDDPKWKRLKVSLPDHDVIEIDVGDLAVRRSYTGIGTILFQLAQRPGTGELWVANTEARNLVRFEPALRGHAIDSRITRVKTDGVREVTPFDLNTGIDYDKLPNPAALTTALSQPTDVAFDPSGAVAYVAAFGTDRIGVLDPNGKVLARIEVGETSGEQADPRRKRGPRGLVHHPDRKLLYVLSRLSNSISTIDTNERKVVGEVKLFDPTPPLLREGRGFLFDAKLSGTGTMSCAACHVDADRDGLAWDLGDPGGEPFKNGSATGLHPMKGPLLTQTLRGQKGERIFHWRADRPGLASFNGSFDTLLGGKTLQPNDLDTFVAYLKEIRFAPNPNRNRDDTLPTMPQGASATDGEKIFLTKNDVGREGVNRFRCVDCHTGDRGSGAFGFTGLIGQPTKAAQLRGLNERDTQRLSGFGFGADGSKVDLPAFLTKSHRFDELTANETAALERFLFAFPTETAPIVGLGRTVTADDLKLQKVQNEIDLLVKQAGLGKCDLIVKGVLDGRRVGFVYDFGKQRFLPDRIDGTPLSLAEFMTALEKRQSVLTFLGVPPANGRRLGIDRNSDGTLDGDE